MYCHQKPSLLLQFHETVTEVRVFFVALQIVMPLKKLILILWPSYFAGLNTKPVYVKEERA